MVRGMNGEELRDVEEFFRTYGRMVREDSCGKMVALYFSNDEPTRRARPIFELYLIRVLEGTDVPQSPELHTIDYEEESGLSDIDLSHVEVGKGVYPLVIERNPSVKHKERLNKHLADLAKSRGVPLKGVELYYATLNPPRYTKIIPIEAVNPL